MEKDLNDVEEIISEGKKFIAQGNYDEAIRSFNLAIELDPENSFAYNERGLTWHKKRKFKNAIKDFDKAIDLNPENAEYYNNRGMSWYRSCNSSVKAYDDFNRAIALDPELAIARKNLRRFGEYRTFFDVGVFRPFKKLRFNHTKK